MARVAIDQPNAASVAGQAVVPEEIDADLDHRFLVSYLQSMMAGLARCWLGSL